MKNSNVTIHVLVKAGFVGAAICSDTKSDILLISGISSNPKHGLLSEFEAALDAATMLKSPCKISVLMNSAIAGKMQNITELFNNPSLSNLKDKYAEVSAMHDISFTDQRDTSPKKLLEKLIAYSKNDNEPKYLRCSNIEEAQTMLGMLQKTTQKVYILMYDTDPVYAWNKRPTSKDILDSKALDFCICTDEHRTAIADVLSSGASHSGMAIEEIPLGILIFSPDDKKILR